jgi:hypothetical protein
MGSRQCLQCDQHYEYTCMELESWQGMHAAEHCASIQGMWGLCTLLSTEATTLLGLDGEVATQRPVNKKVSTSVTSGRDAADRLQVEQTAAIDWKLPSRAHRPLTRIASAAWCRQERSVIRCSRACKPSIETATRR